MVCWATVPEVELIRALAEDLALEILPSYKPEDFADADFTSQGKAAVYLADQGEVPGPALQKLIEKAQKAAGTYHRRRGGERTYISPSQVRTDFPCGRQV